MSTLALAPEPGTVEHLHAQVDSLARHVVGNLGSGIDEAETEAADALTAAGLTFLQAQACWARALRNAMDAQRDLVGATTSTPPPTDVA